MARNYSNTEVAKTLINRDCMDKLIAKASLAQCDRSEYLRDLIYMDLYGVTHGEHIANHRRSVLGSRGTDTEHAGTAPVPAPAHIGSATHDPI